MSTGPDGPRRGPSTALLSYDDKSLGLIQATPNKYCMFWTEDCVLVDSSFEEVFF